MSKNTMLLRGRKDKWFITVMVLACSAFMLTVLLSSLLASVSAVGSSSLGVNISAPDVIRSGGYYILVEHNSTTEIAMEDPTAFGFYGKNNDALKVYTNSPSGYQLYISSDQTGNFASDGSGSPSSASDAIPGNSLFMDGTLGDEEYFAPTTGTYTSPSTSISSGDTVVGSTTTALSGTTSWGFSTSDNDLYAAVPLKNNEVLIKKTKLANANLGEDDVSVAQNVYYGAKATLSKAAGTYSGNVLYTTMSDADSTLDGLATISPTETDNTEGGDEVTIRTSLFTNMADLGTVNVYIGGYTSTSDTPVAADACTNVSASIDTEDNNNLVITCDTPAHSGGTFDVLVIVEKFGKAYLISDGFTYNVNLPAFWTITYMQDMTPEVCNSVYTPTNVTGSSAIMVDRASAEAGNYSDVTSDNTSPKVAQHILYDYRGRDGTGTESSPATGSNMQSYVVRKLADGNCWMAENLQLNLSTSHSYKVGTFAGGEADWTPNSDTGSYNPYNYAITDNYKENIAVTDYRGISHNNWYYTWYGATAGQGTKTTNPSITQSICPKGWRLPLGDTSNKSFYYLISAKYGLTTGSAINDDPLNFYPAGISGYNTSDGDYWSSSWSTYDSMFAYKLYFSTSSLDSQDSLYKYFGFSVRCVSL